MILAFLFITHKAKESISEDSAKPFIMTLCWCSVSGPRKCAVTRIRDWKWTMWGRVVTRLPPLSPKTGIRIQHFVMHGCRQRIRPDYRNDAIVPKHDDSRSIPDQHGIMQHSANTKYRAGTAVQLPLHPRPPEEAETMARRILMLSHFQQAHHGLRCSS